MSVFWIVFLTVGLSVCIWYVKNVLHACPQSVTLSYESGISAEGKNRILDYCRHLDRHVYVQIEDLSQRIVKTFPCIKSVFFERIPPHSLKIHLAAYQPVCTLPDSLLLLEDGHVSELAFYPQAVVKTMPAICLDVNSFSKHELASIVHYVQQVPRELFNLYDVCFMRPNELICTFKEQKKFRLYARLQTVFDIAVLKQVAGVYEQLSQRGVFKKRDGKQWVADVRFARQVVVRSEIGGIA